MDQQITKGLYQPVNKRVYASCREEIEAVPAVVFPLLCPAAEYRWIEGWSCTLVFTKSGVNEEGCIFTEEMTGQALTGKSITSTWVTNRWDKENHCIQFVIFAEGSAVVRYTVALKACGEAKTTAHMDFECTVLSEELAALDDAEIQNRLLAVVGFITASLKHYCEKGEMLRML